MRNYAFYRLIPAIILTVTAAVASTAAQRPAGKPRVETLLNGMRVVMMPDAAATGVTVRLRVNAGSAFDPQGKEGAMQMLAESIFPTKDAQDFFSDDLGGSFATVTNYDYIQLNVSSRPDRVLSLIDTLAAAVTNPSLDKETIESIKGSQLARIAELNKNIDYAADSAAAARLFGSFPYGRPAVGTAESVSNIDFTDIVGLKQRFLTADNSVAVVSGNFDGALVYKAFRQYFGGWLKADRAVPSTFRQPDAPKSDVAAIKVSVGDAAEFRSAARGVARDEADYFAAAVLAQILDGRIKAAYGNDAFARLSANLLPGWFLFGIPQPRLSELSPPDRFLSKLLTSPVADEELLAGKRQAAVDAQRNAADWWLDADTYKLRGSAPVEAVDAVSSADVARVLARLRKEPVASVLVTPQAPATAETLK